MCDLAILLVLVHAFVPEAMSLIEDLSSTWQQTAIAVIAPPPTITSSKGIC